MTSVPEVIGPHSLQLEEVSLKMLISFTATLRNGSTYRNDSVRQLRVNRDVVVDVVGVHVRDVTRANDAAEAIVDDDGPALVTGTVVTGVPGHVTAADASRVAAARY